MSCVLRSALGLALGVSLSGLFATGCAPSPNTPAADSDTTYEVTGEGAGDVQVRYLKQFAGADRPAAGQLGKGKGSDAHEKTTLPFTTSVSIGEGWRHALIFAKTTPFNPNARLHCAIKHNGSTLTSGDGVGAVSCQVYSNGGASSSPEQQGR